MSLDAFGIAPADEQVHTVDRDDPTWNESWFFDWTTEDGTEAGHCRLGWMPGQGRVWVWLFLRRGDSWYGLEATRVDDRRFDAAAGVLEAGGLLVRRTVAEALQDVGLEVRTQVRGLAGPDAGRVVPVSLALQFTAAGPAHSVGGHDLGEVDGQPLTSNRYEQPMTVRGTVSIDDVAVDVVARGERDHSWGPGGLGTGACNGPSWPCTAPIVS